MKNPLKKKDHTSLYIGIAVGAAAGAALGWLFVTEKGARCREQITQKIKESISDTAAELIDKKTFIPKQAAKVATDEAIKG